MISLRGKLERDKESWKWEGQWAFQAQEGNSLPFRYTWERKAEPGDVDVPSAVNETVPVQSQDDVGGEHTESEKQVDTKHEATRSEVVEGVQDGKDDTEKSESNPPNGAEAKTGDKGTTDGVGEVMDNSIKPTRDPSSQQRVTFAHRSSPDDPNFSDAAEAHPGRCPTSGAWEGYFENLAGRKGPHVKVQENFYVFLNATPPPDARITFLDEEKEETESDRLPSGHIHVRGTGENQYGIFEILGSLDVESGTLACQKMYVKTADTITPRPGRSRSKNRSGTDKTPGTNDSGERPYQTRKRQMSWKRRAALEGNDDDGDVNQANKGVTVAVSNVARTHSRKKARIEGPSSNPNDSVKSPTVQVPTGASRRPQASPRQSSTATAAPWKMNITSSVARASVMGGGSVSGQMKLPTVGDPKKARWRAAHFMYYQRPEQPGEESTTAGGTSNGTNSNTAAPKYLVYEGEMLESERDGRGVCLYNNNLMYEGEWKRDKEHGRGTLMTSDRKRIIYKGEWERGRMQGMGVYYYGDRKKSKRSSEEGSRYEGEFKENLRHGTGTYVLPDGSSYSGTWREGLMSGRGLFIWNDGSRYDGEWKDGKRHGQGLLVTSDGFQYDGTWVHNSMEGRGSATYPNNQEYHGLFSNGRREGRGTIIFRNGARYEGRFKDDAVDGQGTMKMSRTMVVPRASEEADPESERMDFMIPLSFQSDMGHIHRKAGFTVIGD